MTSPQSLAAGFAVVLAAWAVARGDGTGSDAGLRDVNFQPDPRTHVNWTGDGVELGLIDMGAAGGRLRKLQRGKIREYGVGYVLTRNDGAAWDFSRASAISLDSRIGMVDVTDQPYPAMIHAARRIGDRMYSIRAGMDSID